jgi:hypothetical protein
LSISACFWRAEIPARFLKGLFARTGVRCCGLSTLVFAIFNRCTAPSVTEALDELPAVSKRGRVGAIFNSGILTNKTAATVGAQIPLGVIDTRWGAAVQNSM